MELLPLPVLAEMLAMLPYQDFVKFERVSKLLRIRIIQNASLSASFVNLRFDLPAKVRLQQASFAQLKHVIRVLSSNWSGLDMLMVWASRLLTVNGVRAGGSTPTFCYSIGSTPKVITSISLYRPRGSNNFTMLILASLQQLPQPQIEEYSSLFAQANNVTAVSALEQAGLMRITSCYDFEQAWKLLSFHGCDDLRPVLWVQLSSDFTETITLDLSRPILAGFLYLYPINTDGCAIYMSARGAELDFVAS